MSAKFHVGVGIENTWVVDPASRSRSDLRPLDIYALMQHDQQWRSDLQLVRELSVSAIRYSVPWYKANPAPGCYIWDELDRGVDWLLDADIVPIIDLLHYTPPTWMHGGLIDEDLPRWFAEYGHAMAKRFHGRINHYTPVNEPQTAAMFAGFQGRWPPYLQGAKGWCQISVRLAETMVRASQALRHACPDAILISADHFWNPAWEKLAEQSGQSTPEHDAIDDLLLSYCAASLAYGRIPPDSTLATFLNGLGCDDERLEWFAHNAQAPDIFGVNFYPYGWDGSETGCQLKQDALIARCLAVSSVFKLPIYITETSGGATDRQKQMWIDVLREVTAQLRASHVDLRGINWWPRYETVQWDYRENGESVAECIRPGGWNNGLYRTEPRGAVLARIPTPAAAAWAALARDMASGKTIRT